MRLFGDTCFCYSAVGSPVALKVRQKFAARHTETRLGGHDIELGELVAYLEGRFVKISVLIAQCHAAHDVLKIYLAVGSIDVGHRRCAGEIIGLILCHCRYEAEAGKSVGREDVYLHLYIRAHIARGKGDGLGDSRACARVNLKVNGEAVHGVGGRNCSHRRFCYVCSADCHILGKILGADTELGSKFLILVESIAVAERYRARKRSLSVGSFRAAVAPQLAP